MMKRKNEWLKKSSLLLALMLAFVFAFAGCATKEATKQETKQETVASQNAQTATLKVSCAKLVEKPDVVPANKKDLIPQDGIILLSSMVEIAEGETAFSFLQKQCKENNIQMDYNEGMIYVKSIYNIAEKDCGNESGWMYKVNGEIPQVGAAEYKLKSGDEVEFIYVLSWAEMM